MKMYINGKWVDRAESMPVLNPFDQSIIDTVPRATAADVEDAITSAARGAEVMTKLPAFERYTILRNVPPWSRSVDAGELGRLFDLAGWQRPHSFVQTLRNAARSKFRWLERMPGRSGYYTVTEVGRETALGS